MSEKKRWFLDDIEVEPIPSADLDDDGYPVGLADTRTLAEVRASIERDGRRVAALHAEAKAANDEEHGLWQLANVHEGLLEAWESAGKVARWIPRLEVGR